MARNPPWADLPPELLSAIADFLTSNQIDILAFRAVCKSWNFSSPSPSPFILSLLLPLTADQPAPSFDVRFHDRKLGAPVISVTVIYAVRHPEQRESESWVLFADQLTPGKIMIRQPFSKDSYSLPINFPGFIDVTNIHVDEIGRFYNLSFHPEVNKPPIMWSEYVHKVVLNSDESAAVALFRSGLLGRSKLRISPNWVGGEWEPVGVYGGYGGPNYRIDDVVSFNGRIVSVDRLGRLYDVIYRGWEGRELISGVGGTRRKRLVESNEKLYLVVRGSVDEESNGDVKFTVFGVDVEIGEWVEVNSLDGWVLFFGLDFSFSVSPQEFGGCFGTNCIVYKEGSFRDIDGSATDDDDDIALFNNLKSGDNRIGVWHMKNPSHCGLIGSYPACSSVLWPPPAWLWPNDISKRLGDLEVVLDDLLKNVPAEKLKTLSKDILELVKVTDEGNNELDFSEDWRLAHTMKICVNEGRDLHKHIESRKANVLSQQKSCKAMNQQTHENPFSETEETRESADSIKSASKCSETCDAFLLGQTKLHGVILNLEETTTKLSNTLKTQEQPSVDAIA